MSYFVFSRKYRPQTFGEVLAQHHITETLTKAIEHERVSQAYLFCGVRGTGKTSVARILAKRLNCANPQGAEPCNQCDSCKSIQGGHSLDILEIDAASNTSVDDIRDLRESIKYAPVGGKHKVYIVDEVHRLSPSAFDALLKTLEEPPAHAVFIFATTEVHKVPQTILSRCQRYDFRRVSEAELRQAVVNIAAKESIKIDDAAADELARRSDGSLRDALSLLDQVASWQRDQIDMDLLAEALGILPRGEYRAILQMIRDKQAAAVITKVNEVLRSGIDATEIVRGMQEVLRHMLLVKAVPDAATELGVPADDIEALTGMTASQSINDLLRIQNLLVNLEQKMRDGFDPKINLELALLKLVNMESSVTLSQVLEQLASGGPINNPVERPKANGPQQRLGLNSANPGPAATPAPVDPIPEKPKPRAKPDLQLGDLWQELLRDLKSNNRNLQIKLSMAQPREIKDDKLMVAFDRQGEFHVRQLQERDTRIMLEERLRHLGGKDLKLHFYVDQDFAPPKKAREGNNLFADSEKEEHPLVVEAMTVLDAKVIKREDLPNQ
ncbi:MAG: DNA polymerase III subunit gamma/tau [bacterium]